MKTEIYCVLTRGDDGLFVIDAFSTLENAREAMKVHIECQEALEGVGVEFYVDYHPLERLSVPGFVLRPESVISHVTVTKKHGDKITKTDRYIVKVQIS